VVELGGWPLIGRAEELEVIAGAIGKSSASAGVVIFGNLGVGKSRLAHDAASRCDGAVVRWAAGSSAARAIPLGAFVIPEGAGLCQHVVDQWFAGFRPPGRQRRVRTGVKTERPQRSEDERS
jgi:hypothetical protein